MLGISFSLASVSSLYCVFMVVTPSYDAHVITKKRNPQLWEPLMLVMTQWCLHNQNTHRAIIEQPHCKCDEGCSSSPYDKFAVLMWFVPAVALCFQRSSNGSQPVIKMLAVLARSPSMSNLCSVYKHISSSRSFFVSAQWRSGPRRFSSCWNKDMSTAT